MNRSLWLCRCHCFATNSSRCISKSWGLTASFNSAPKLQGRSVGLFGNELLREASGFKLLNEKVRRNSAQMVQDILSPAASRTETTVKLFDDLSNEICCAADVAECIRSVHPDPKFAQAAEDSMIDFTELVESLNTKRELYDAVKASLTTEESKMNDMDRRVIEMFLADFAMSGVHLPSEQRQRFVDLSGDIFEAGSAFSRNANKPVRLSYIEMKVLGTRDRVLSHPMHNADSSDIRRHAHNLYYAHSDEQEEYLRRLVKCRHEMAQLTGYCSYSDRAQQFSLLGSAEKVERFLVGVIEELRPQAESDLALLSDLLRKIGEVNGEKTNAVGEWDISYLSGLYRQLTFGTNWEIDRFFTLGAIMEGFGRLIGQLYGVRLELDSAAPGEVWSETVQKLTAYQGDALLGHIYCDLVSRPSKTGGDCHFTVRCFKMLSDGKSQTPIVVVSLSLPSGNPVYLSPHQAETLFHEMGHALHSMLGRTKYQHVAGTRCSTDMAEIPSNLMEYFFSDSRVLCATALDKDTGEALSVDKANKLIAARAALSALETVQQAVHALFDLRLHGCAADAICRREMTTTQLYADISQFALPNVIRDQRSAWQHRFGHLVPYGARYYSYLVARASASLIWNSQFKADPFSRSAGERWAAVQSHGGELPSGQLLAKMLGFTPTADDLVIALKREIEDSKTDPAQIKK